MVHLRAAKVAGIARSIPPLEVDDPDGLGGAPVLDPRLGIDLWGHRRRGPSGEGTGAAPWPTSSSST